MVVQQHVLNWLYSVLTSVGIIVRNASRPELELTMRCRRNTTMSTAHTTTWPRHYRNILPSCRGLMSTVRITSTYFACLAHKLVLTINFHSISQRLLCSPPSSLRHNTGKLPRHHIPISHIVLDSSRLPPRGASRLRYSDRHHGGQARSTCRPTGTGLSSIPCWLGRFLGCMLFEAQIVTRTRLTERCRNQISWISSPSYETSSPKSPQL